MDLDNFITAFDFNPAGESIATINAYGVCLISDVNTNNYAFHLQFENTPSSRGKSEYQKYTSYKTNLISTFLTNLMIKLAFFLFLYSFFRFLESLQMEH